MYQDTIQSKNFVYCRYDLWINFSHFLYGLFGAHIRRILKKNNVYSRSILIF